MAQDKRITPEDLAALPQDELLDLVEQALGGGITVAFSGKANAARVARKVRPRVLRKVKKLSVGPLEEQALNRLIEGDNLQAMSTLYRERGRVNLILTDPPYNTGNDFRYNDKWETDPNDPGMGDFVSTDDGARHTKWMRFMWPRLQMMKSMLRPDGVLAICIDQRELFRLGAMLDELFGERNRIAIINWQKSYSTRADQSHVSTSTEYVLVYAKDESRAKTGLLPRSADMDARYVTPDGDRKPWKPGGDLSAGKGPTNQGMVYAIQSPFTGELHYPPAMRCWAPAQRSLKLMLEEWGVEYKLVKLADDEIRAGLLNVPVSELKPAKALMLVGSKSSSRKKALERLAAGTWPRVVFGSDGDGRPSFKRYLEDVKQGKVPTTYWADDDYDAPLVLEGVSWPHTESGHSQTGVDELTAIVGDSHGFKTVKPLRLFEKIIRIWCPPDGLILDPFAGSGTTGHAALSLNNATGSNARFILIEQGRPERGDSYAQTLTADRLARVVTGKWSIGDVDPLGGGICFERLDKKVDGEALLQMEREEMVDTVIASHFDANRKRGSNLVRLSGEAGNKYLVARNTDGEGFFLIWEGPNKNTDLTMDVYEQCAEEAERAGLKPVYHVYARLYLYQTDNIRFYQIPDRILSDFGLDISSEPFNEEAQP